MVKLQAWAWLLGAGTREGANNREENTGPVANLLYPSLGLVLKELSPESLIGSGWPGVFRGTIEKGPFLPGIKSTKRTN